MSKFAVSQNRRRMLSVMTISLLMVLGLSFGSVALAQEARWKALNNKVEELYKQGKYREAIPVAKEALNVAEIGVGLNQDPFLEELITQSWR